MVTGIAIVFFKSSWHAFANYHSPKQFTCMIHELNLARSYSWELFPWGYAILEIENLLERIFPDSTDF